MRILFVHLPATGHVLPLIPLARALRTAGHDVAFATAAGFAPQVEAHGFRTLPAGMEAEEWDALSEETGAGAPPEWSWQERIADFGARVFAGGVAQRLIDDLAVVLEDQRPDLVVHEDTALGAAIAAERGGIPHVRMMILAAGPAHPLYSRLDEAVDILRARSGLGPESADRTLHRHLVLHPFPPSLLLPGGAVPPTLRSIRPALPPATAGGEAPELDALSESGSPVVYATLGTIFNGRGNDPLFRAYLAAFEDADVRVLLTVGRDRDPADFGPQPPHVHVVRYVPLTTVLRRCDAVLSHGGSGTVVAALAHGLPQVLTPIFADQPENAARVAELGAGVTLAPSERSAGRIREAVLQVLGEPAFRENAERLRDEIADLPGADETVALVERIGAKST